MNNSLVYITGKHISKEWFTLVNNIIGETEPEAKVHDG